MDLNHFQQAIRSDGFAVIDGLCDGATVESILSIAKAKSQSTRDALGDQDIGVGSAAGYDEIVQRSPGRWDVPVSPDEFGVIESRMPWHEYITVILGTDAEHSFSGVVSSDPGSPAQRWHTDSPHIRADHGDAHALNVLIALQDIPLDMGPTEVASGSHRLTNHLANPSLVAEDLIYQDVDTPPERLAAGTDLPVPETSSRALSAGTALIFDDRLLHRGLANRSDQVRHVAYFSYRKRGYSENTHFESTRSVYED